MLVKIKDGDKEFQFDSTKVDVAILLTPSDKRLIENMAHHDQLIVSAPFSSMKDSAADVWTWAMTGWKGATYIDPGNLKAGNN